MPRNFNGTSDRITADGVLSRPVWWSDSMGRAWAGWVKAPPGQSNVFFFSEGLSTNNGPFWGLSIISASPPTNLLRWSGTSQPSVSGGVVADNTWHHVALVIDNSGSPPTTGNNYFLYLDGALQGSAQMGSTNSGSTFPDQTTFGALRRIAAGNFFKGLLAHWAIWNRPLSAEEVRMLARGMRLPSDFAPQHYFPFTDGEVGFALDCGRRRNHGTLVGTAVAADAPPVRERVTPATWPHRYGAIAIVSAGVTVTLTDSGILTLAADLPTMVLGIPSGEFVLAADPPTVYPVIVGQGSLTLDADPPAMAGPIAPDSGALILKGDAPLMAGPIQIGDSGVLRLAADPPTVWTGITPLSGKLELKADAPTVTPIAVPSAKLVLKADPPTVSPLTVSSARLTLRADPPVVTPIQLDASGRLMLAADSSITSSIGIVLENSGILRLKADIPIITPLTEPVTPPPPLAGEGVRVSAVV